MFDFIGDDDTEHCGLLIGTPDLLHESVPEVGEVVELLNRAEDFENSYVIYRGDVIDALALRGLTDSDVVGFWHSHPSPSLPGPSQDDLDSVALGARHWWHAIWHPQSGTVTWYDYYNNIVTENHNAR